MSWYADLTIGTKPATFAALSLLGQLGCQPEIKTKDGLVKERLAAEKGAEPASANETPRKPRIVRGECNVAVDGGMSAFAEMHLTGDARKWDEIWRVLCYRGECEIARLDANAVTGDGELADFQVTPWRGSVSGPRNAVYDVKILGMADQRLVVDLGDKSLRYRQVFKNGAAVTGVGSCTTATVGDP